MRSALILAVSILMIGCTAEATDGATEGAAAAATAGVQKIAGTVLETQDVSSYTYVRFQTSTGEAWAAVPATRLEVGSHVEIANPQAMANFESKTLGRRFETIYFGTLQDPNASAPATKDGTGIAHGGIGSAAGAGHADSEPIAVPRAEGETGRTIAELYKQSNDLSGKRVALRGKVVKYNAGIMGRNWIHLQDGTGDEDAGTHDITVTSSDSTVVGQIALVEGTVALDKDFGAGYRYNVIVEDASLK